MTQHYENNEGRAGHHWKETGRVLDFAQRMDARQVERQAQFALMAALLPFEQDQPIQVLDIGAGYGAVAAAVLQEYPRSHAVLLDVSEAMIALGHERMREFEGRYRYVQDDFAGGTMGPAAGGPYDAIVSSLAIHHLPEAGTASLYRDIATRLAPGGCFLNLDIIGAPDATTQDIYEHIDASERAARGEPPREPEARRHDHMIPLDRHLEMLRDAGFAHVDCFWKRLGTALFGGFRAGGAS